MPTHQTAIVLFDLALIIVAARPLGPMILGPHLTGVLFPSDVRPLLGTLGTFGLALFMFTVGLDLGHRRERSHAKAASVISLVSVALPLGLGIALAVVIAADHAVDNELAFAWPCRPTADRATSSRHTARRCPLDAPRVR